jgi:uracil-DNA glycosylase
MPKKTSAAEFLPPRLSLAGLRQAAAHCKGCELYVNATQTVFGEGLRSARLLLVGETPGDKEDLQGKPFVGPAGQLLDDAIVDAGLARNEVYITNAVKHFRWEPRGKRRLHKKPSSRQIHACRPWLEAEIAVVKPQVIVCLGATAAQSLLGTDFRISWQRGEFLVSPWSNWTLATHHPSAVLRAPDKGDRVRKRGELVHDLRMVVKKLASLAKPKRAVPR